MNLKNKNIGFFDSGIGGISVLKRALKILEHEIFVYFGDSKNSPYGNKSQNDIIKLCINICNFLIYENNCKAIVIACNTASSAAIKFLRSMYEPKILIIGIEPALKPATEYISKNKLSGKILVLATNFTISGDKFKLSLMSYRDFDVDCVALKDLAFMIEKNVSRDEIYKHLYKRLYNYIGKVECVVIGCTHYYFVEDILRSILGENLKFFNGIDGTINELNRRLCANNIKRDFNQETTLRNVYIYNSLDYKNVVRSYELLGGGNFN